MDCAYGCYKPCCLHTSPLSLVVIITDYEPSNSIVRDMDQLDHILQNIGKCTDTDSVIIINPDYRETKTKNTQPHNNYSQNTREVRCKQKTVMPGKYKVTGRPKKRMGRVILTPH